MPRCAREIAPGSIYHVTARGNRRQVIFHHAEDYRVYIVVCKKIIERLDIRALAYVLMPNHVHWVLSDPSCEISTFIHHLHGWYAQYYNRKYGKIGHIFQDRFYSKECRSEEQLIEVVRYTHLNSTRAHLVSDPADDEWSSFQHYCSKKCPDFLDRDAILQFFGSDPRERLVRFRQFTYAGMNDLHSIAAGKLWDLASGLEKDAQTALHHLVSIAAGKLGFTDDAILDDQPIGILQSARDVVMRQIYALGYFSMRDLAAKFHLSCGQVRGIVSV